MDEKPCPESSEKLRSAINKSIDSLRAEVDKQTEKIDQEAKQQDFGLGMAMESPLWQKRANKKLKQNTTAPVLSETLAGSEPHAST